VQRHLDDLLDRPYFHVVFTVLECFNVLIRSNQDKAYAALFHAAPTPGTSEPRSASPARCTLMGKT
jgi:hypothetical protein